MGSLSMVSEAFHSLGTPGLFGQVSHHCLCAAKSQPLQFWNVLTSGHSHCLGWPLPPCKTLPPSWSAQDTWL